MIQKVRRKKIKNLDKIFKGRLYRDSCIETERGLFLKDLRLIEDRSLENIILVDNSSYSFLLQPNNGIPILSYFDQNFDKELEKLMNFLILLAKVDNILEILQEYFRLRKIMDCKGIVEAKKLFGF